MNLPLPPPRSTSASASTQIGFCRHLPTPAWSFHSQFLTWRWLLAWTGVGARAEAGAWNGAEDRELTMIVLCDGCFARLPIAHVVYNLIPPMGNIPSLLTFEEVVIVFHEFGHALQRMLTKQDEGLVSSVQGIEWDAVELSSLFMEKWCYHKDTLMSTGKHYNTKKSIPESLCTDLLKNVELFKGLVGLHQVRRGF